MLIKFILEALLIHIKWDGNMTVCNLIFSKPILASFPILNQGTLSKIFLCEEMDGCLPFGLEEIFRFYH